MASTRVEKRRSLVFLSALSVAPWAIYRTGSGEICIMIGGHETVLPLRQAVQHLDERAAALRAELEVVNAARAALLRVADRDDGVVAAVVDDQAIVAEIERCRNQRQALRHLARSGGGRVRVRDAAKLIVQSRLTKGKVESVRATLLRYVKESPDWVEEGDGYYRLVGAFHDLD